MQKVAITDAAFATLIDGVKNSLSKEIYPNSGAIYYGKFDMEEAADECCEKLNKKWEECFGEQK